MTNLSTLITPVGSGTALEPDEHATLAAGFDATPENLVQSSFFAGGIYVPEVDGAGQSNYKSVSNNDTFEIRPPSTSSATSIRLRVSNAVGAGPITHPLFDKVNDPDGYTTTNGKAYWFFIDWDETYSTLTISEIV